MLSPVSGTARVPSGLLRNNSFETVSGKPFHETKTPRLHLCWATCRPPRRRSGSRPHRRPRRQREVALQAARFPTADSWKQGHPVLSLGGSHPALMNDRVILPRPLEAACSRRHLRPRLVKRPRDEADGMCPDRAAGKDFMASQNPLSRIVVRFAIDCPNRHRPASHCIASHSSSFCRCEKVG
jgi:hypothetical protein